MFAINARVTCYVETCYGPGPCSYYTSIDSSNPLDDWQGWEAHCTGEDYCDSLNSDSDPATSCTKTIAIKLLCGSIDFPLTIN